MRKWQLTWGTPHYIDFEEDDAGKVAGLFCINKKNGDQPIPLVFPEGVSISDLMAAWIAQGSEWHELYKFDGQPFVARRVLWLTNGMALVWDVCHLDEVPRDSCVVMNMQRKDWPFEETIMLKQLQPAEAA